MTRERMEQIVLMVLAMAVLLVGSFYAIVMPQWTRLQGVRTESQRVKTELADARAKVDGLPRLMQKCRVKEATVTSQERQFVGDGNFDAYLDLIKRCADGAGMSLGTVQLRGDVTVPRGPAFVEHWVTVDTKAPYHTIGAWIALLEKASPFVRVIGASVRTGDTRSGQHAATITIAFLAKHGTP
jgi:Tfp pilus assembly protein PilO